MITHKYIDKTRYISGLPATDLDANTLTDYQRLLLADAVSSGIYQEVKTAPPPQPVKKVAQADDLTK